MARLTLEFTQSLTSHLMGAMINNALRVEKCIMKASQAIVPDSSHISPAHRHGNCETFESFVCFFI